MHQLPSILLWQGANPACLLFVACGARGSSPLSAHAQDQPPLSLPAGIRLVSETRSATVTTHKFRRQAPEQRGSGKRWRRENRRQRRDRNLKQQQETDEQWALLQPALHMRHWESYSKVAALREGRASCEKVEAACKLGNCPNCGCGSIEQQGVAAVAWVTSDGAFNVPVPVYQCSNVCCARSRCHAWPTDVGCFPASPAAVLLEPDSRAPAVWLDTNMLEEYIGLQATNPEVSEQGISRAVTAVSELLGKKPLLTEGQLRSTLSNAWTEYLLFRSATEDVTMLGAEDYPLAEARLPPRGRSAHAQPALKPKIAQPCASILPLPCPPVPRGPPCAALYPCTRERAPWPPPPCFVQPRAIRIAWQFLLGICGACHRAGKLKPDGQLRYTLHSLYFDACMKLTRLKKAASVTIELGQAYQQ